MNAATTLTPAYYAPLCRSRHASGTPSDREVWLDEALEGTDISDWRNHHDAAFSCARRISVSDGSHATVHTVAHETQARTSLSEALQQVYALQSLRDGWNGYDSLPPAGASIRHAQHWLEAQWQQCQEKGVHWYAPNVTADAEGTVVFEWWAADRTLSVYFSEDTDGDSKGRTVEYLKFGRRGGPLADLREAGMANTTEEATALMRWFGE